MCEQDAQERAQDAVRRLSKEVDARSVTIVSLIQDRPSPTAFLGERAYRRVADRAGYTLETEIHQHRHGYDHRLLLVRPLGRDKEPRIELAHLIGPQVL